MNLAKRKILTTAEIHTLFKNQSLAKEWAFLGYKPTDTGKWTHTYHRYPAKFIPQLVEKLLDEYVTTSNAHINDPFMGSGTTIVTAIARGLQASGTDVNKIACLMTKVKATPIEPDYLDKQIKQFVASLACLEDSYSLTLSDNIEPLIPVKHLERINYWFNTVNRNELGKILRMIDNQSDVIFKDFLSVAFSHILKNCSIWLQGSNKPTRDVTKVPAQPVKILQKHLRKMQKANHAFYQVVPATVRDNLAAYLHIKQSDATQQPVAENSVDLVISSSPYVTSYEYADLHQLSTIWLDLAENLIDYRKCFIGTATKAYADKTVKSEIANDIVQQMAEKNQKMAQEIKAFFIDMQAVFAESFRILKPGGRCCYVIGNTKLQGVNILNAQVFTESLQYAGFSLDRVIMREIPSKILPQKREESTGRFASGKNANMEAYPTEYIVIGVKE